MLFMINKLVLFHFAWLEKGSDPETAEATIDLFILP